MADQSHNSHSHDHSVTNWIEQVKQGIEGEPQERLVQRFLAPLTRLARKLLGGFRSYEDEDDVAVGAMKSFLMRAPRDEFGRLMDRDALWSLLVAITHRKAVSLQRRHLAEKRAVNRNVSLEMLEHGPTPEMLDTVLEDGVYLLDHFQDEVHKKIARAKLEGYTNTEIAKIIDRSVSTVERKLEYIRGRLESELEKNA